jgi:hypothetical protein
MKVRQSRVYKLSGCDSAKLICRPETSVLSLGLYAKSAVGKILGARRADIQKIGSVAYEKRILYRTIAAVDRRICFQSGGTSKNGGVKHIYIYFLASAVGIHPDPGISYDCIFKGCRDRSRIPSLEKKPVNRRRSDNSTARKLEPVWRGVRRRIKHRRPGRVR